MFCPKDINVNWAGLCYFHGLVLITDCNELTLLVLSSDERLWPIKGM